MPEKLDKCVADVKGKVDNPWAVCNASIGKKIKEKVNQNRQDPYPSPKIKNNPVEPHIQKTPKGIGGGNPVSEKRKKQESILFKQIFDTKLRQYVSRE